MTKISALKIYCFLLLLLSAAAASGQGYDTTKWRFSSPKQFGFTTLDVDFFDNNVGIAVGPQAIGRSTDGGKTWTYAPFIYINAAGMPARADFNDVHFVTSTTAYAVGTSGMMVKTTDAGLTWNKITTPLTANLRNINTVWFTDQNTGYIGGQWNTADSIPKVYRTTNGGATWDSLASPAVSGTTKVGFVSNATYPAIDWPITGKAKEIQRIIFLNNSIGYISGGGASDFPSLGIPNITNATTCAPTGTFTTSAHSASLLWKFDNGTLTDYSLSKERLGYTGIPVTVNCTSKYGAPSIAQTVQQYRALNIINDSIVVMMSFNNNIVIRVNTGKNDSTQNINRPGVYEKGRWEVLNTGNAGPPAGYPPIPAVQVLTASNPYHMQRTASGTLCVNAGQGRMWTSVDTGRNWVGSYSLPRGQNFSTFNTPALEILPNGKFITMGIGGVLADSIPGAASWQTSYSVIPVGGTEMEFVDCANGIGVGGPAITVTEDGGATWIDKTRPDFLSSFYNINGMAYPNLNKVWFAVSNGTIYISPDKGTTLDPSYSDPTFVMHDVAGIGNDTVYAVGYSAFSVPAANRKSTLFRSFNGGTTWTTVDIAVTTTTPAFTAPTLSQMAFPSRNIGYVAGSRNGVYKTTDAGNTWTDISPFPALNFGPAGFPNSMVTYTEVFALNDNTVFLVGNMFTNVANRRVYKTTDGGATWVDITGNIPALFTGNIQGVLFHDANNGYVCTGAQIFKTNDGGTTWSTDISPSSASFQAMAFSPRTVPAGISFANRKLVIPAGLVGPGGTPSILEYGRGLDVNVNATTTVVNTNCGNASGGSITVNATGGIAPYTYNINGGAFQTSNVFSGLTAGVKTIQVKDAFCGITTIPVTVSFTDNLTLTANNDTTVCAGAPVPMLATATAGATYAWTPTAGLSSATIANPVATVTSATTYTVTATLGTCVKSEPVVISIKPAPSVSAGPDKTIVAGDEVMLNGSATSAVSITWTPAATLTNANTLTPIAKPATTTTYTLSVRNSDNCTSTDDVVVNVIPYCVNVMNAFTPNGDGMNDLWKVTNGASCATQIQVAVYNRYGNEVYKNNNYNNDWNGTYNGKPVADGTYYYRVTFRLLNGSNISVNGDVTILR